MIVISLYCPGTEFHYPCVAFCHSCCPANYSVSSQPLISQLDTFSGLSCSFALI
uniref:Uncharacterized protein n=1 Tax=Anguilla anguilla TaxID=7936 RepID=A0A0E9TTQ5_ANGAN